MKNEDIQTLNWFIKFEKRIRDENKINWFLIWKFKNVNNWVAKKYKNSANDWKNKSKINNLTQQRLN